MQYLVGGILFFFRSPVLLRPLSGSILSQIESFLQNEFVEKLLFIFGHSVPEITPLSYLIRTDD